MTVPPDSDVMAKVARQVVATFAKPLVAPVNGPPFGEVITKRASRAGACRAGIMFPGPGWEGGGGKFRGCETYGGVRREHFLKETLTTQNNFFTQNNLRGQYAN